MQAQFGALEWEFSPMFLQVNPSEKSGRESPPRPRGAAAICTPARKGGRAAFAARERGSRDFCPGSLPLHILRSAIVPYSGKTVPRMSAQSAAARLAFSAVRSSQVESASTAAVSSSSNRSAPPSRSSISIGA